MAKNKYLQITFGDAIIHEFSKTPKEGYEEQEGGKGFRKHYMKGLYGRYKGTSIRDGKFGKQISIAMLDIHGDTNYLNIPLFDNNNSIGIYAEGFLTYLPYLLLDHDYRIYAYSMDQQGTTYQKKGISIKYANITEETVYEEEQYKIQRLTYSYTKKDKTFVSGMIPAVIWENKFGKNTKNSYDKDMYLWNILHQYAKDETQKPPAQQQPGAAAQPAVQQPPMQSPPAAAPVNVPQQQQQGFPQHQGQGSSNQFPPQNIPQQQQGGFPPQAPNNIPGAPMGNPPMNAPQSFPPQGAPGNPPGGYDEDDDLPF